MKQALKKKKKSGTVNREGVWGTFLLLLFDFGLFFKKKQNLGKIQPFLELLETLSAGSEAVAGSRQRFKCS